ncbi:hypothetical protein A2U01_0110152, partial [Trifolium medium]|nr:hypothetical protein [Trifolium medium]
MVVMNCNGVGGGCEIVWVFYGGWWIDCGGDVAALL